jgi:hypothetical protein
VETNLKKINDYLDRALNIIISLEEYASEETSKDIEALFQEIKYGDDIDADMRIIADLEAQDYETFGDDKI